MTRRHIVILGRYPSYWAFIALAIGSASTGAALNNDLAWEMIVIVVLIFSVASIVPVLTVRREGSHVTVWCLATFARVTFHLGEAKGISARNLAFREVFALHVWADMRWWKEGFKAGRGRTMWVWGTRTVEVELGAEGRLMMSTSRPDRLLQMLTVP